MCHPLLCSSRRRRCGWARCSRGPTANAAMNEASDPKNANISALLLLLLLLLLPLPLAARSLLWLQRTRACARRSVRLGVETAAAERGRGGGVEADRTAVVRCWHRAWVTKPVAFGLTRARHAAIASGTAPVQRRRQARARAGSGSFRRRQIRQLRLTHPCPGRGSRPSSRSRCPPSQVPSRPTRSCGPSRGSAPRPGSPPRAPAWRPPASPPP
jgi:hypothetical protein